MKLVLIGGPANGLITEITDGVECLSIPVRVGGIPNFDDAVNSMLTAIQTRTPPKRLSSFREARYRRRTLTNDRFKLTAMVYSPDGEAIADVIAIQTAMKLAETMPEVMLMMEPIKEVT